MDCIGKNFHVIFDSWVLWCSLYNMGVKFDNLFFFFPRSFPFAAKHNEKHHLKSFPSWCTKNQKKHKSTARHCLGRKKNELELSHEFTNWFLISKICWYKCSYIIEGVTCWSAMNLYNIMSKTFESNYCFFQVTSSSVLKECDGVILWKFLL